MKEENIEIIDGYKTDGTEDGKRTLFTIYTISFTEYKRLKSKEKHFLNPDSNLITITDSTFIIKTKTKNIAFNADKRDYSEFNYYRGYIKSLQLFALDYVNGTDEYGVLVMVDRETGKTFYIESASEYPFEKIFVSNDTSKLAAFTFDLYTDMSYILFFDINIQSFKYTIIESSGLEILKCKINDFVWIDKSNFAIETTDPNDGKVEKKYYLKIRIN